VNIDGVHSIADFKVIEIMDNIQPHPMLMGLEWAFENYVIINMNKREMIFEVGYLKVVTSLDPREGKRYMLRKIYAIILLKHFQILLG
jgi:hypothetical protein